MNRLDIEEDLETLMTPEIMQAISGIHEHRGKQDLYLTTKPEVLDRLTDVAKIQSTAASNAIENIRTSNARLRELVQLKTAPRNRDEREIMGYKQVLDLIHGSYEAIEVTPNVILQLHRNLYSFQDAAHAGKWKDSDNVIAEIDERGKARARFVPTPAVAVPDTMTRLCDSYAVALARRIYDPLLAICAFVFDFTCIHPFVDGNGRMSRLLTLLLLYKCNYLVGKYVSIENRIEQTKESYYSALSASSVGWHENESTLLPFASYLLGIVESCYQELDERVLLMTQSSSSEEIVRNYLSTQLAPVTKREIMESLPTVSQRTLERVLSKLQKEGAVEKVGAARSTAYRWVG